MATKVCHVWCLCLVVVSCHVAVKHRMQTPVPVGMVNAHHLLHLSAEGQEGTERQRVDVDVVYNNRQINLPSEFWPLLALPCLHEVCS